MFLIRGIQDCVRACFSRSLEKKDNYYQAIEDEVGFHHSINIDISVPASPPEYRLSRAPIFEMPEGEWKTQRSSCGKTFWHSIVGHCQNTYSPSSNWESLLISGFVRDMAWYGVSVANINLSFRETKALYGLEGQMIAQWLYATAAMLLFTIPISLFLGKSLRSTLPIIASASGSISAWDFVQNRGQAYFEGLGFNETQAGDLTALLTGPTEGAAQLMIFGVILFFIQRCCPTPSYIEPASPPMASGLIVPFEDESSVSRKLAQACRDFIKSLFILIFSFLGISLPGGIWQVLNVHLSENKEIPAFCSAILLSLGVLGTTVVTLPFISTLTEELDKCALFCKRTPRPSRRIEQTPYH
jgi:hypothetical protein